MLYDDAKLKKELTQQIESFKEDLKKISTGKPNVAALESLEVEAYGTVSSLNAVGQVIVEDAVSVRINVWDKSILPDVEKAMRSADLGASVFIESDCVRLRFNPITEQDRKDRVKLVGKSLEERKIRVRQVRQDFRKDLDDLEAVSEDEVKRDQDSIQKAVDKTIEELESIATKKETELMSV